MAFHPHPQVIAEFFNIRAFGPPQGLTPASTCPWIAHSVSGLPRTTIRPCQTRFRFGYTSRLNLAAQDNSLPHYAKGTRSPGIKHRAPTVCKHTVSGSLSLPLSGSFSPFPHGTCSLSVDMEYLALEGGPPRFPPDFTCPAVLRN